MGGRNLGAQPVETRGFLANNCVGSVLRPDMEFRTLALLTSPCPYRDRGWKNTHGVPIANPTAT